MALAVQGVANLTVEGLRIEQAGGDGIYLGQVRNFNISIRQVTIWQAFRNGLTVGNIEGVRVEDTVIGMTNGTAPMAGVDFESDMCFASLRGVFFRNVSVKLPPVALHVMFCTSFTWIAPWPLVKASKVPVSGSSPVGHAHIEQSGPKKPSSQRHPWKFSWSHHLS